MADTITVAAYHKGLPTKEEMDGRERVIVSDDGTDKTVAAEVLKTYIGEISGGNAEELAVWESAADDNSVTISTRKKTDESGTMRRSVTIPVATETQAGVMSAEQVKALAAAGNCASAEALETEITERKDADATLAADITTAKTDIAANAANIATAQADITQAKSNIADVQSAVQTAQASAESASAKAGAAESAAKSASADADAAISAAASAQESADGAKTAAASAQSAADNAASKAQTAQETASAAKQSAETAQTAASAAQDTADGAKTAASAAQDTADGAKTAASTAQTAASSAQDTAEAAKSKAEKNAAAISSHAATLSSHTETLSSHTETLSSHTETLASHTSELADHEKRVTALEEGDGTTEVVAVAKAAGGTITIGTHSLSLAKGTNRFSLPSGQEGFALDAGAKAGLVSLSLTGAKVKARATDLQALFNGNVTIHSLHLPALDVSAVTTLKNFASQGSLAAAYLKAGGKLASLTGIEDWDVSKVTNFSRALANHALTSVDLSRWDVSSATDLSYLFSYTVWVSSRLTSVGDLSAWDTGKCTSMAGLFNGCASLRHIGDISKWDISQCTSLLYLFFYCSSLTSLDLSGWDTSKVTSAPYLFFGCSALTELDVSGWDLRSLSDRSEFPSLGSSSKLTSLKLGEGWGRIPGSPTLDLSSLTAWTGSTVKTLLELYDRTQDETLGTMTIKLSANTYTALGADNISALTEKGYTITK